MRTQPGDCVYCLAHRVDASDRGRRASLPAIEGARSHASIAAGFGDADTGQGGACQNVVNEVFLLHVAILSRNYFCVNAKDLLRQRESGVEGSNKAPSPEMKMHPSISPDLISPQQEANLRKLAAYLLTLPADYPDFEMDDFVKAAPGQMLSGIAHLPMCGTAACAVGHGPVAGFEPNLGERWIDYSHRLFISESARDHWSWCFSGTWSGVDNTVHGAANRIIWMMENGLPEDAFEQEFGKADLCYLPVPA